MKIYVIIQEYYDGCSVDTTHCGFTFSESKAKDKVEELTKLDNLYLKICEEIDQKQCDWEEANPYPTAPSLGNLPPKDLVWNGDEWENAYMIEYRAKIKIWQDASSEFMNHIIDDVKKQYSLDEDIADTIPGYPGYEYSYLKLFEL